MKVRLLCILLCLGLTAAGCSKEQITVPSTNTTVNTDFARSEADMFTERDGRADYNESECTVIELKGDSAYCSSDSVSVSDGSVSINKDGTFLIKGTLDNGKVTVNAPDDAKIQIIFAEAHIKSEGYAPFKIISADKVFITLADGTDNSLVNGGAFNDGDNVDGALFSRQDLTVNGGGALTLESPAGHGIVCKDDMVFTGGNISITAASHAIDANDSVRIRNTVLTLKAGKDGIHADNSEDESKGFFYMASGSLNIESEGDGISASAYGQIEDGEITILAGGGSENGNKTHSDGYGGFPGGFGGGGFNGGGRPGGRPNENYGGNIQTKPESYTYTATDSSADESTSMKGIKTAESLLISGGNYDINSADDGLHSNSDIAINGGSFKIASGDDGVHADENLQITDCKMDISECYEGLEAHHIKVAGGDITLAATDDGLNAAGGSDSSGMGGRDNGNFGGPSGMGGPGGMGGHGGFGSGDGSIVISGGKLYINSSGDGIDANGTLEISGGHTTIVGPTVGDTATLDYDASGVITGGTFIGTGASGGMAQSFSGSENQGVIAVSVGNQSAGTEITLKSSSGDTLITHSPELDFAVVILSSPDMVKGQKYTVTVGGQSKEFTAE